MALIPIENGTDISGLTVSADDLIPGTTYYAFVRSDCDGDGYSTWAATSFYIGYCLVTSTSTINGISNFTTTNGLTNISNATGPGTYNDYTAQSVSMYESGTVNFSITSANGTTGMGVWVDWNNDLDFGDDGEHVYNSGEYLDMTTGSITVPIGTAIGSYRMRVVANWLSTNPTPCGDLGNQAYGEAEDYTFIVSELPDCVPPSNFTATVTSLTTATLNWTVISPSSDGYEYVITSTPDEPTESGTVTMETSAELTDLTFGTVYAYVRANCGDDGYSLWTGPIAVTVFEGDEPCTAIAEPCTAIALEVMGECVFETFDNTGASTSDNPNIPAPECAFYQGSDMWFTITVPANGIVMIDGMPGSLTDCGMAVYSGTSCEGQLTLIDCDDDSSDNGAMPYIEINDPNLGDSTLYIRFWEYGGKVSGTFGICVTSPCSAPSNILVVTSDDVATASWSSAGDDVTYTWEVRTSGDAGSGPDGLVHTGTTDATTIDITGLEYLTPYNFYVSTNCSEDVSSPYLGALEAFVLIEEGCMDTERKVVWIQKPVTTILMLW